MDVAQDTPIIKIFKTRKGSKGKQYKVNIDCNGRIFFRKFTTKDEANRSLDDLKKKLVENQGPTIPILIAWEQEGKTIK